jgi:hypothetical protein
VSLAILQSELPFSPSDLPWWVWLVAGVVLCVVAAVIFAVASEIGEAGGCICAIIALVLSLAGGLCLIIGIVRLVKWVWYT